MESDIIGIFLCSAETTKTDYMQNVLEMMAYTAEKLKYSVGAGHTL